jgi:hypothetical protein
LPRNSLRILAPILALLIPFAIRLIPEALAWPYPIGFDTIYAYVPWIESGYPLNLDPLTMLKGTRLFPLLALLVDRTFFNDAFLTVKILGPLLHSLLGLSMYIFARRVLKWDAWKSLLLAVFSSIYFVSLRISWEMYRQMLGTIFLILTLSCYWSSRSRWTTGATPLLTLLTILSHEITGVTLLALMLIEALYGAIKRDERLPAAVLSLLIGAASLGYMFLDLATLSLKLPFETFVEDRATLAGHIIGFIIFCYAFLLPFMLYGIVRVRNRLVFGWLIIALIPGMWPIIYPSLCPPLWFRWIIFMAYPACIYSTEGVYTLLSRGGGSKAPRIIALAYLCFIGLTAGYYLAADPEHAFPYFADYNPYKAYIQSSMLQSTIPLKDIESTIQAAKWLSENAHGLIVLHEAFYPWAMRCGCLAERLVVVRERDLSKPDRMNFADALMEIVSKTSNDNHEIYTIWWANGKGWYNVPSLPSRFQLVKSFGDIGIYVFRG